MDFVCRQISPAGDVSWRKMFGDYVVYLDGKPVFTVCGDTCYAKDLPAVARLLPDAERGRRGRIGRPDGPYGMARRPIRA